jgi:phage-related minor tail protein
MTALSTIFGQASGGPVTGGRTYMVGERGPELFTAPGNGNIVPNNKLAMAGGGTTNVNITYDIKAFDSKDATAAIAEQAPTIVGIVEQSFNKRGRRGPLGV